MRDIRFIHCADLHIDSPFRGLSEVDADVGGLLRDAAYASYEAIIELAISQDVDAVIIAGDVYDGAERGLRAQFRFADGLKRLAEKGIAAFVAHGNHDPLDGWSASLSLPATVTVFGGERPERAVLVRDGKEIASVYGISFPTQAVYENLAAQFKRQDQLPSIAVLHCNVGGDTGHEPYAPATLKDLTAADMDYWALGHVHRFDIMKESHPTVVYPGNAQARHIRETGARGCCMVTMTPAGDCKVAFHATDRVRFDGCEIDVSGCETLDAIVALMEEAARYVAAGMDGRDAVLRLELTGRTDLQAELSRDDTLPTLTERVRECLAAASPGIWIEQIRVSTQGNYDIEMLRQETSFAAEVIAGYDDLLKNDESIPADITNAMEELFKWPQARRYLSTPNSDDIGRLLLRGRDMTLDLLLEDE